MREMGFIAEPITQANQIFSQYLEKYTPDNLHLNLEFYNLNSMIDTSRLNDLVDLLKFNGISSFTLFDHKSDFNASALAACCAILRQVGIREKRLCISAKNAHRHLDYDSKVFTSVCFLDIELENIFQSFAFAEKILAPEGKIYLALLQSQDLPGICEIISELKNSLSIEIIELYGKDSANSLNERLEVRRQLIGHNLPIFNHLFGSLTRPFACPASNPRMFFVSSTLELYKCPASSPEKSRIGQIRGTRAFIDPLLHQKWVGANGYIRQQVQCAQCPVLPKCFGEACPKSIIENDLLICPTAQEEESAELLYTNLEDLNEDETTGLAWFPRCKGESV